MKRFSLIVFVSLLATPLFSADRFFDLTGWATWVKPQSNNTFNSTNANQPFDINFEGKLGYGAGLNVFLGDTWSVAFDASEVKPDARYGFPGATLNQGSIKMIPITGVLQWHLIPKGFIDPYLGAGAAYVIFDNLQNVNDVGHVGVNQINFKDDAGFVVNGGLGFNFSPRVGITADVKYVPLKASATAVFATGPNQSQKIKINPVIASAGLTLHF
ncbi:MAG TPA: OmpW family outer membrane protein [Thermoanaerobaculia bacterium]|nr:OmpW family outer membrane protein [Thermoanaerobaculia bacterium]